MHFVDARRLTGPNLLSRAPLVVVELELGPKDTADRAVSAYLAELGRVRVALGLPPDVHPIVRAHLGGVVIGYGAPIDELLVGAEASEWAGLSACQLAAGGAPAELEPKATELRAMLAAQRSVGMRVLAAEARRRGVPFLWDDVELTVGLGAKRFSCPREAAVAVDAVPWASVGSIPVVLITGTNGKTTSARLMARVAKEAGYRVGLSSTSGVVVDEVVVEAGDYTGPAAARLVLRRDDVDFAVLETARGGLLRRGLALDAADGALITNVSDDHLGLYGIDDLEQMTRVKGLIAEVVPPGNVVALNAKDPNLVALAARLDARVTFFADLESGDSAAAEVVASRRARGLPVVVAEAGAVWLHTPQGSAQVAEVSALPLSFEGVARYNVENVLGVVALAHGVGLPLDAITRAVTGFGMAQNPGRGELVQRRGLQVLLDFGHNPEAVRAVLRPVRELRRRSGGKLTVVTGSAGDRSDKEIEDIARAVLEAQPDRVLVRDLPDYLRGRQPGEVPALFTRLFAKLGLPPAALGVVATEVDALAEAFATGKPGDVIAVLVHLDHDEVHAFLRAQPAQP